MNKTYFPKKSLNNSQQKKTAKEAKIIIKKNKKIKVNNILTKRKVLFFIELCQTVSYKQCTLITHTRFME